MLRSGPHPTLSARGVRMFTWAHFWLTACVWQFPVALYAFAVLATIFVGHWPSYGQPDPMDLGLPLYAIVIYSPIASAFAAMLWLGLLPFFTFALGLRRIRWMSAAFVVGSAVGLISFFGDALGLMNWLAD